MVKETEKCSPSHLLQHGVGPLNALGLHLGQQVAQPPREHHPRLQPRALRQRYTQKTRTLRMEAFQMPPLRTARHHQLWRSRQSERKRRRRAQLHRHPKKRVGRAMRLGRPAKQLSLRSHRTRRHPRQPLWGSLSRIALSCLHSSRTAPPEPPPQVVPAPRTAPPAPRPPLPRAPLPHHQPAGELAKSKALCPAACLQGTSGSPRPASSGRRRRSRLGRGSPACRPASGRFRLAQTARGRPTSYRRGRPAKRRTMMRGRRAEAASFYRPHCQPRTHSSRSRGDSACLMRPGA
mmetsp:Transcript_24839/g.69238  ORF Transcript_24839/g.69238 Transcript_24839/m.69238 type:complete len:292 (-) Transcript_24839:1443-2318(-)